MTGEEEREIIREISQLKALALQKIKQIEDGRHERAKEIRRLYFTERKKQAEIALIFGIAQGSVSRLVSELSCPDIKRIRGCN